ncbi:winged helix-turn-helix domain-containing protein [Methanolobus bombayensis]|uniref:winged helix-turn-helix domain-containing protein n=1 Tax=Methanolobus bombayensis TaxID=38023 RepID=UPI001FD7F007|nr:winged helix-turn-helix domain-containing protein [Methanolobus bombayensis]MBP1909771.1 DNA-binding transcriptional ArsR family regulator [Methanolobus bombayensis]
MAMSKEEQDQRRQEWYERVKKEGKLDRDPKEDHDAKLKTLQNPVRRNIIKSLNEKKMTFDELKAEFNLDSMPLKLHLGMLEDTLYIEKEDESTYVITPRGEDYLESAEPKDDLKKRRDEWYEKVKKEGKLKRNPTEDHKAGLKAMQNPIRRQIVESLGEGKMTFDEVKSRFDLNDVQAKLNLDMLVDTLYIEKEDDTTYVITVRGEAFLENVDHKHL